MKNYKMMVAAGIIAALFLLPGAALAENETTASDASSDGSSNAATTVVEPATVNLTLEDAIAKAMTDNGQVKLQEMAVETSTIDKRIADNTAELLEDYVYSFTYGAAISVTNSELATKQAEIGLDLAKASLEYTKQSVKFGVESAYYATLQAGKYEEAMVASLERAKKQWEDTQAKYKVGVSAKMDVLSAESAYLQAQADLNQAKDNTKIAKMSLCQLVGLDVNTDCVLKSSFSFEKITPPAAAQLIEEGKTADLATYAAYCNKEIVALSSEETMGQYPANTYQHRQAVINLKDAEIKYEDALNTLEISVNQVLMDLATGEANYAALQKSKELAEEAYRLAELRYQNGLGTVSDLLSAEAALKQAEMGELAALYNYNMAKAKINYGIFSSSGSSSR